MKLEMYCNNCNHEWREDEENANCYECPQCHSTSIYRSRYITCSCGATVYCDGFTNECDGCGALYNGFGQLLAPPSQWDDDDRYDCFGPQDYDDEF